MIVWGGDDNSGYLNTGGRYNPVADAWTSTTTANAPTARHVHSAVWTGSEMIVWGGLYCDFNCYSLNTGGRYNPSTDSWTATSITNAPSARSAPAVWTGSQMIVWGGTNDSTGGRYNPSTDSWIATSTSNAPEARGGHTAVWTGSEMIVWGGRSGCCTYHNTGGRYNPSTDSWTATSTTNAPAPGFYTAVWTSSEMIVWGGLGTSAYLNTGGRYPAPFDTPNPSPTPTATATVTASPTPSFGTGGRYDPGTDSWRATSTTNAPSTRVAPAVWTGSEMIVWGGAAPFTTNTGGRYCAQFAPPTPTPTATATATATPTPTATSTPRPTPTPRSTPPARPRPTPPPRP